MADDFLHLGIAVTFLAAGAFDETGGDGEALRVCADWVGDVMRR
jgi:hypothetical protein